MTTDASSAAPRMSGDERREQILTVARHVFARGGYAASTDDIARAAGVSQPYVVRLFGSKRALYVESYRRAAEEVRRELAAVPAGPDAGARMGQAYLGLVADTDLRLLIMQGFMSADPEVQAVARDVLGAVFGMYLDKVAADTDAARAFVAHGMLINVLLGTDAPAHADEAPGLAGLVACTVPEAFPEGRA